MTYEVTFIRLNYHMEIPMESFQTRYRVIAAGFMLILPVCFL